MSTIRVFALPCPHCRRAVAALRQVATSFEVHCDTEGNGCGHIGGSGVDDAAAVAAWNDCARRTRRKVGQSLALLMGVQ
jgi:hypothetical protein